MDFNSARMLGAALAIGIGAFGPAIAVGLIGMGAMQSLGRNPEASGTILSNMIIVVAFAESIAIYALFIAILLVYTAKPVL
jgi:F-type H+-transporting ATPase subunit c